MTENSKTPMMRTEYDARILQYSRESLAHSYRVLRETDALLAFQSPRRIKPDTDPKPRQNGE